jgi:uncharacterized membrane protein YqjE
METVADTETEVVATTNGRARALPIRELIAEILGKSAALGKREVELARAEIKADLLSQVAMVKAFAVAAVLALLALNLLLVAIVAVLSVYMPFWLSALLVAGVLLLAAGLLGWVTWSWRLTAPLAVTRRRLRRDLKWVKEQLT